MQGKEPCGFNTILYAEYGVAPDETANLRDERKLD